MRAVLLGTAGGPSPKRRRAAPALAIVSGDAAHVVDCGSGTARQLALAGIPSGAIENVFITHHHSDHVADLVTLPLLLWADGLDRELVLHGPPPLREAVSFGLRACAFDVATRCADEGRRPLGDLLSVREILGPGCVLQAEQLAVSAARVKHPPIRDAYAYRFDSPEGSIVVSGDTAPCAELIDLARGADVLVHEVLLLGAPEVAAWLGVAEDHPLARHVASSHSHYSELGRIATEAGVRKLVLSHFVPGDAEPERERILDAIRADFAGEVILGEDLLAVDAA